MFSPPAGGTAMLEANQVEELICVVSAMDRETVTEQLTCFRGSFPVDFTREFLDRQPVERLRHLFVALCLQTSHVPEAVAA
jgi:hypothetical protein